MKETETKMRFEVKICHLEELKDTVKWCDEGVGGEARLICFSISLFFLALTIIVYIMEKSVR